MLSKVIAIFLVVSLLMANSLYAHSGNTDSSGCHNDNINGGYHCHNSRSDSDGSDSSGTSGILIVGIIVATVVILGAVNKTWSSKSKDLEKAQYIDKLPIHVELSSKFENNGINGGIQFVHQF